MLGARFTTLSARVLDLAVAIQQIPAPTFSEAQRGAFLQVRFEEEGLADIDVDELGNVYGRLPGAGLCSPLVVSAHTDTVFPASLDLHVQHDADRISGPGIGDNSLGVAGLLGLVWALQEKRSALPGDLWLVANVAEEGLGDLLGMRRVVERFGDLPLAYLVLEGMALGQVYHRGLGVRRYRITAHTAGGHSWVDFGRPSAIHELAKLVARLTALPLSKRPRCSLNVGIISGGTSINTIAAEAWLELDLRSESAQALLNLVERVEWLVQEVNRQELAVSMELIGERPMGQIPVQHPLVQLARRCLEAQGIKPNLTIGSTDANVPLSRGLPAVCLGLSIGGGAHTQQEYIHTAPLQKGLDCLVEVVEGSFRLLV
jgi:tripeptide aminopeptidase